MIDCILPIVILVCVSTALMFLILGGRQKPQAHFWRIFRILKYCPEGKPHFIWERRCYCTSRREA